MCLLLLHADLDFRMQLDDKEDEDEDIQPSSDEDDPPDEPPSHGISEGDLQKMIDERNERDQSPSLEVHPSEVPIRAEDVAKPSSSDYRKDPLFDVFTDYDRDPNVTPNGEPTPKGYIYGTDLDLSERKPIPGESLDPIRSMDET